MQVRVTIKHPIHKTSASWFDRFLKGWSYNKDKRCFEKFRIMTGYIKEERNHWAFYPDGENNVYLIHSYQALKKHVIKWHPIKK